MTLPDGVTSIGESAFRGCTGLTSVNIPDGVTSIGGLAFRGCTGLTSVNIPDGVTGIGWYAFFGCIGLTSVNIGNGVTSIESEVFRGCTSLTSVTIGNGVTSIGELAFEGCRGLTSINIPYSVTEIKALAFWNCTSLADVVLEDGTTDLTLLPTDVGSASSTYKYTVFESCPIKRLYLGRITKGVIFRTANNIATLSIGNSVELISGNAFGRCGDFTEIYSKNPTPPYLGTPFQEVNQKSCKLFVPKGSLAAYKTAQYWKDFFNIIEVDEDGTVIIPVTDVTLNQTDITLTVAGREQLIATVQPTDVADKTVTWSSDNTNVAAVDDAGLVTAVSAGTATITVTTTYGGKMAFCLVTVTGGTAIDDIDKDKISIYNIPDGIGIATTEATPISIFNIAGQKVHQSVVTGSAEIYLNKGVYIVRVNNGSRKIIVK